MNKNNALKLNIVDDLLAQQNILMEKGNKCISLNQFDAGINYFNKVLSLDTKNKECLCYRSHCYLLKGKLKLALNDAVAVIGIDGKFITGYLRVVNALIKMLDYSRANDFIKKAESLEPNNSDIKALRKSFNKNSQAFNLKLSSDSYFKNYVAFIRALYDRDAYFQKIELGFGKNSRGVFATEDIKYQEVILQLPKKALITLELAKESQIGRKITKEIKLLLNSPNHSILSSFLLEEISKGAMSEWKFYIDMLPIDYSNFPIFYSNIELDLLQGTQFMQELLVKKKEIQADYNLLHRSIIDYNKYSFEQFCQARMLISSRIFGININNQKTDVLAPFADLLNHKRPRQTHWSYKDKFDCFEVIAIENISKGAEVFDSYGKKCNGRFLLNYGFVIENNEDDIFKLTLTIGENCPMFNEKKYFLNGIYVRTFILRKCITDIDALSLLSNLRFICFDGELYELFRGNCDIKELAPISIKNERETLKKLMLICESMMKNYKTTIEEDVRILQTKKNISFNHRNCITIRYCEKDILRFYIDLATYGLKLLEMKGEVLLFCY